MEEKELYYQDTEFKILDSLIPHIQHQTFIDIGAEKGLFATYLIEKGFSGALFEPCPKHYDALEELTRKTDCHFLPLAIDNRDREADFFIHCDEHGNPLDYYHSLHRLADDPRVSHQRKTRVQCRSLESLQNEGIIGQSIGILKTDTEGNDLQVLEGIGRLRPEVLICEFLSIGLYTGWEDSNPGDLIAESERLGYKRYLAIKRFAGLELVSFGPAAFFAGQWGNIIFLSDSIYKSAYDELKEVVASSEKQLFSSNIDREARQQGEIETLRAVCAERLQLIHSLQEEAEKRLEIIHRLERDLKKMHGNGSQG